MKKNSPHHGNLPSSIDLQTLLNNPQNFPFMKILLSKICSFTASSKKTVLALCLSLVSMWSWAQNVDITISAAATAGGAFSSGTFTPSANTGVNINVTDLVTQLTGSTTITINTAKAGAAQTGN